MDFPETISLIWNSKKDWEVKFSNEPILSSKYYINTVKLRNINKELQIYGKIEYNPINNISQTKMKKIYNKTLLKSNLQKCIRRGRVDEALITALNLIHVDFLHFIRRIIIISIEDVGITDNLPFLVWLLIAYPNYEISNEFIQFLLLTVYSLCIHKTKYNPTSANNNLDYKKIDYSNIYKLSLLIREEYGGMKGDMKLIHSFINSFDIPIIKVKIGNLVLTRDITKNDILLESIDFHCYPDMLEYIKKETGIDEHTIKLQIWNNNSKYNFREKSYTIKSVIWEKISEVVKFFQIMKKNSIYIK